MKIITRSVWSALEDELRNGISKRLHCHQGQTLDALRDSNIDVIINKAMTGDGKSLATQLKTLLDGSPLLAMYPTNELIRDQQKQIARTLNEWDKALHSQSLCGGLLDELISAREHATKAEAIKRLADNNDIILTNPDIFHYICQFFYTRKDDAPDLLFGRVLLNDFDVYVFDEFHIFEIPQIVSILNALLLIREAAGNQQKKFLFLSATPQNLLEDFLLRAGFRVKSVQGEYTYTNEQLDPQKWRRILQASDITFHAPKNIEEWVDAHLNDTLLMFFKTHRPNAKGALIVNSVAAAHRLAAKLKPRFAAEGLTIELNTGLTGEETKRISYESDLLIGTATVDVGVDFRINFLVFESRDSGTFLQRLGRLGRHQDDGRGHTFETFEAHAIVPNFVAARLFTEVDGKPPPLTDGDEFTREALRDAIMQVYSSPTEFRGYAREWGGLQSAEVYRRLSAYPIKSQYETTRARLKAQYQATFGINVLGLLGRLKAMRDAGLTKLVEEAQSFRGASPFACGVIDMTEQGAQRIKGNDLFRLAPNFELEWLSFEEFEREARKAGVNDLPSRFGDFVAHFRLWRPSSERRALRISIKHDLAAWSAEQFGEATVIDRVTLDMAGADWLSEVNAHLHQRHLVALLCQCPPNDLRYRLRLPPLFELHDFISRDGVKGTIAFARDALLLHVAIQEKHFQCGGGAVIV